jgi:two-component system LytT family response regulator
MRAIIVDDEEETLEEIRGLADGFRGLVIAGVYTNPLEALAAAKKVHPDCAFLDIEMPGMNGIELAGWLLELNPHMEVVFITAFNHYATQAFELEALDYVLKPIHPQRFQKALERITDRRGVAPAAHAEKVFIRMFGRIEIQVDGMPVRWNRTKARELLAYLIHHAGQPQNKYRICDDLWPEIDPHKALVNLQTTLCALRKSLGEVGRDRILIGYAEEAYSLRLENVEWDVGEFEALYAEFRRNGSMEPAAAAAAIYTGEYLGDGDWGWADYTAGNLSMRFVEMQKARALKLREQGRIPEMREVALVLVQKRLADGEVQRLLLEEAFRAEGAVGVRRQVEEFGRLYREDFESEVEPEVVAFCNGNGVKFD